MYASGYGIRWFITPRPFLLKYNLEIIQQKTIKGSLNYKEGRQASAQSGLKEHLDEVPRVFPPPPFYPRLYERNTHPWTNNMHIKT